MTRTLSPDGKKGEAADAGCELLQAIRDYCTARRQAGEPAGLTPETQARQKAYARVDKPIPIQCSYMLGGGEYLDFSKAW